MPWNSAPQGKIEIDTKRSGDFVLMSLSSEGQSIPPEMIDVAFERFYRIPGMNNKENGPKGLGLGLAIAKTIAEIHRGRLDVKNRPEGGMIFSLFLPV